MIFMWSKHFRIEQSLWKPSCCVDYYKNYTFSVRHNFNSKCYLYICI